jgi:hypothetical protein
VLLNIDNQSLYLDPKLAPNLRSYIMLLQTQWKVGWKASTDQSKSKVRPLSQSCVSGQTTACGNTVRRRRQQRCRYDSLDHHRRRRADRNSAGESVFDLLLTFEPIARYPRLKRSLLVTPSPDRKVPGTVYCNPWSGSQWQAMLRIRIVA